ncbi:MAG: cupredoxin domain-containing protein [Methanoregula sp.]|nr:cupredoxin domain-containing protein [Methanoregula sp.]
MQKWFVLLVLAALFALVGGCTEQAPSEQPSAPAPTPTVKQTAVPHTLPTTVITTRVTTLSVSDNTITIMKNVFNPAELTIKVGSQVRWVNGDSSEDQTRYNPTHRISLGNVKDSPLLSPGQSWSWTFTKIGVYDYSDMLHTTMHGTVTVVE